MFDPTGFPEQYLKDRLDAGEKALIAAMEPSARAYAPRSMIVREGDQPDRIFRIVSGRAVRRRTLADGRTQLMSVLLPGDIFGANCALGEAPRASAEAQTWLTAHSIRHDEALQLLIENSDVALWFVWRANMENARFERWLTVLTHGDALEKIAALLTDFYERFTHTIGTRNKPFRVPLTQREIADYLGLTLPHVCRTFAILRERGLVNVYYGSIEISDPAGLAACAENVMDPLPGDAPRPSAGARQRLLRNATARATIALFMSYWSTELPQYFDFIRWTLRAAQ